MIDESKEEAISEEVTMEKKNLKAKIINLMYIFTILAFGC